MLSLLTGFNISATGLLQNHRGCWHTCDRVVFGSTVGGQVQVRAKNVRK